MCGICGILSTRGDLAPETKTLVSRMVHTLGHRGPDDSDCIQHGPVALGHTRLAVIDLSSNGRQPMSNEDETIWLTYNGEIYNFRQLKRDFQLAEKGHQFRSDTDTEVLIHLYEELGINMVEHLNGMFAFAIWDGRSQELHLVRDRFGVKPLFYTWQEGRLLFASEIKAILNDPTVRREVDLQALHDYLSLDYVPGHQTMFAGIKALLPGHRVTISADGRVTKQKYATFNYEINESLEEHTAVDQVQALMEQAIERQLVADVPVGVLLSGGLDSSTILALMRRCRQDAEIRTYAVGFDDRSFDERPWARQMAESCNAIHEEVVITPAMVRESLVRAIQQIDEPYADGSAIPTFHVCQRARQDVVVVLSGEGGDELFAGYETYAAFAMAQWCRHVPRWVRNQLIAPLVARLPVSESKLSLEFRLKRFLGGLDLPASHAHLWWRIVLTETEKWNLYTDSVREQLRALPTVRYFEAAFEQHPTKDVLNQLLAYDSSVFLPNDLMVKNDRMSMAHSLEARVPFTDLALTNFVHSVPVNWKLHGLRKKHLLREAMANTLPRSILNKKKVGLEMPYSRWLKRELYDLLETHCSRERLEATGLFCPESVHQLIDEHLDGKRDNGRFLWGMLNFMVWWDIYLT